MNKRSAIPGIATLKSPRKSRKLFRDSESALVPTRTRKITAENWFDATASKPRTARIYLILRSIGRGRNGILRRTKIRPSSFRKRSQLILRVTKYSDVSMLPVNAKRSAQDNPRRRNLKSAKIMQPYKTGPRTLKIQTGSTLETR